MDQILKNYKNKILPFVFLLLMAVCLPGCGGSKEYLSDINPTAYVTLGEYKGLEVTADEPTVPEADIESYILSARVEYGKTHMEGREIATGDTVSINYEGYRDEVAFDGGTGSIDDLEIGSGRFIPGFEDGLIGAKVGDQLDLDLTFPENYTNAELAGAAVVFKVTVNSILPEYDDAFVQGLGMDGISNTDEYHDYVYAQVREEEAEELAARYDEEVQISVVSAALANCVFKDPPEDMKERLYNARMDNLTAEAGMYGMNLDTYMTLMYGMDQAAYEQAVEQQAIGLAQQYIMYQAIADAEGLNPGEDEITQERTESMELYGIDTVEEFNELIGEETFREYVLADKVVQFLVDNSVVTTTVVD